MNKIRKWLGLYRVERETLYWKDEKPPFRFQEWIWALQRFFRRLRYEIPAIPRRVWRGLKWFFYMYNDEDWDQVFLLLVIQRKLRSMLKLWENKDKIHIVEKSRMKNVKSLRKCLTHLTRLIDDNYHDCKEYVAHCKKWGKIYFEELKEGDEAYKHAPKGEKLSIMKHENAKTKKQEERMNKEFSRIAEIMDKRKMKDQEEFFKAFKENYEYWWD